AISWKEAEGRRTTEDPSTPLGASSRRTTDRQLTTNDQRLTSGTFALGAPEMLREYLDDSDARVMQKIVDETQQLAEQGLRVLLAAHHPDTTLEDKGDDSKLPCGIRALGLVSIRDELRGEAREALNNFILAGVSPKIISGDHPETVAALAKQAGLKNVKLVSGIELAKMSAAQFREAAKTANVFGRITPQQKQKLVQTLRAEGY